MERKITKEAQRLSEAAYQRKLEWDRTTKGSLKIPRGLYEEVQEMAERGGITLSQASQRLLRYALEHARFVRRPVYAYDLVFDGEDAGEDEE